MNEKNKKSGRFNFVIKAAAYLTFFFTLLTVNLAAAKLPEPLIYKGGDESGSSKQTYEINIKKEDNKYSAIIFDVTGTYQTMMHNPSQHIRVEVNGKSIYAHALHGTKNIVYELPGDVLGKEIKVKITVSCNNNAHTYGCLYEVKFLEGIPGHFYVTDMVYHTDSISDKKPENVLVSEKKIKNDSSQEVVENISFTYAESKTMTWNQSDSQTKSIKFSASFPGSESVWGSVSVEIAASASQSWSEGGSKTTTETATQSSTVTMPPHSNHKISLTEAKLTQTIPVTYYGYILDEDGKAKKQVVNSDCVYVHGVNYDIIHTDLGSGKTTVLKSKVIRHD